MAKITDYPSITTIDANTILLADGSSGTGKILASDMAKYALETYAGSTLAGSAQSVKAAFETAGKDSFSLSGGTLVESGFNFDTCLTVGNYYIPTTGLADSTTGAKPINSPIGFLKVLKIRETANFTTQMFFVYDQLGSPYVRNHMNSTGKWSEWLRVPTRGEFENAVISSGTPETVTASTDINDYTTPGTYFFNSSTKAANAPDNSGYFRLTVTAPTGSLVGTNRVRYQEALTSAGTRWTRLLNSSDGGSTWTAQDWMTDPSFIISGRSIIAANTDLNTLIAPGAYRSTESAVTATLTNCPVTSYGFNLDVIHVGVRHFVYQRLTHYTGSVTTAVINEYYRFINVRDGIVGAWTKVPTRAEVDALNSNITIDVSNKHTMIPSGSDFNSYTTPGVYYVESDASGAKMVNIPRKSSGKLIVMARHTSGYLAQYFYPSTAYFIRYVRSYGGSTWSAWTQQDINYENASNRQYELGSISSASNKTFEELGLTKYQYGSYFVVIRADGLPDGTWAGIVRHNSAGYQISEFYKGEATNTPYVTTDGIIKSNNSTAITCYGLVFPINVWGNLLS